MLDTGYLIFRIAPLVTSKNIQHPDARIQDQLTLATVFIMASWVNRNILCNHRVHTGDEEITPSNRQSVYKKNTPSFRYTEVKCVYPRA